MAATTTSAASRADREKEWDFHLRSLSSNARDSSAASDPASDPYILQSVRLRLPSLVPSPRVHSINLPGLFIADQEDTRDIQRRRIGGAGGAGVPADQQAIPAMRLGAAAVADIPWSSLAGARALICLFLLHCN